MHARLGGFRLLTASLVALLLALCGCDDPTRLRPATIIDKEMVLFMILDADTAVQALLVDGVDVNGWWEGYLRADLFVDDTIRLETVIQDSIPYLYEEDRPGYRECHRYAGAHHGPFACISFNLRPEPGREYRLRVSAEGRPTAEARTVMPGPFELLSVQARGYPPGTGGLEMRWTASEGAYRYIIGLRSREFTCYHVHGCLDGWYVTTDTTAISTRVSAEKITAGDGPWTFEVYAVSRELYEYFTTGSGGSYFAVPPISHVEGGYGVLGAWRMREHKFVF